MCQILPELRKTYRLFVRRISFVLDKQSRNPSMVVAVMNMCHINKLWVNVDGDIRYKAKSTGVGRWDCWRSDTGRCKVYLWSHVESVVRPESEQSSNNAIKPWSNRVTLSTDIAVTEESSEVWRDSEEV